MHLVFKIWVKVLRDRTGNICCPSNAVVTGHIVQNVFLGKVLTSLLLICHGVHNFNWSNQAGLPSCMLFDPLDPFSRTLEFHGALEVMTKPILGGALFFLVSLLCINAGSLNQGHLQH